MTRNRNRIPKTTQTELRPGKNLLDELWKKEDVYENTFQSGRDQPFMQKKKKKLWQINKMNGGLPLHKYRYLSSPIYAVKVKL